MKTSLDVSALTGTETTPLPTTTIRSYAAVNDHTLKIYAELEPAFWVFFLAFMVARYDVR